MPKIAVKHNSNITCIKRLAQFNWHQHLVFILTCLTLTVAFLTWLVQGEFPTSDDPAYIYGIHSVMRTGILHYQGVTALNVMPVYLAACICKLFGFSYVILRYISLAFGLFGALGLYCLLKRIGLHWNQASILSAIFLFNPLIISLSTNFMSDIPAIAFSNWATYFGYRAIESSKLRFWILTGIFLTMSISCRQNFIVLVVPLILFGILTNGKQIKKLLGLLFCLSIPIIVCLILDTFMPYICDCSTWHDSYKKIIALEFTSFSHKPLVQLNLWFAQFFMALCYLGLFCLPLIATVSLFVSSTINKQRWFLITCCVIASLIIAPAYINVVCMQKKFMPFSLSTFIPPGIGSYAILNSHIPVWDQQTLHTFTICGCIGAIIVLALVIATIYCLSIKFLHSKKPMDMLNHNNKFIAKATLVAIFFTFLIATIILTRAANFDRYYLMLLCPTLSIIALGMSWLKVSRFIPWSLFLSACLFVYSIIAVADNMNFNRCRWEAIKWLQSNNIPSDEIDGGAEFSQLFNPDFVTKLKVEPEHRGWDLSLLGIEPRNKQRWWPVKKDHYIVAGSILTHCHILKTFSYWSTLKFGQQDLYALEDERFLDTKLINHNN